MFGSIFLSVVASTTALVRHNLPAADWQASALFTTVLLGQIVGPVVVTDCVAAAALAMPRRCNLPGLVFSALALALRALSPAANCRGSASA